MRILPFPTSRKAFRNAWGAATWRARADGRAALVQPIHKPNEWREKRRASAVSWCDYADLAGARP